MRTTNSDFTVPKGWAEKHVMFSDICRIKQQSSTTLWFSLVWAMRLKDMQWYPSWFLDWCLGAGGLSVGTGSVPVCCQMIKCSRVITHDVPRILLLGFLRRRHHACIQLSSASEFWRPDTKYLRGSKTNVKMIHNVLNNIGPKRLNHVMDLDGKLW